MPRQTTKGPESSMLQASGTWSPHAARERLSSTLFIAALAHGILILGVTFTADSPRRDPAPTSLDVVIVTREYEKLAPPQNPALLAAQNLIGRGNAPLDAPLRTALPQDPVVAAPGPDQTGESTTPIKTGNRRPAELRLTAATRDHPTVVSGETGTDARPASQRQLPAGDDTATDILAEPDSATVIPDANPRELLVSASTRESRIAGYLNSWKTKVERIGTLNFPHSKELARMRTFPVLEVAVSANGDLKDVVVRNSSGFRNLDQAAMQILRIAAPFEPFPQALKDDYDVLRFEYEWHFRNGISSGRVTALAGS